MAFQQNAFQHNALNVQILSGLQPFVSMGYFQPMSEPVRPLRRAAEFQATFWNSTEVVTLDRWFAPLSVPVKPARPVPIKEFQQASNPAQFNSDPHWPQWIQPLSVPVRRKEAPQAVSNRPDGLGLVPEVSFGWWAELNQPTRRAPRLSDGNQSAFHFAMRETVTGMRWFMPMSEPVHPKDSRHIFDRFALGRPPIVSFGWFVNLSIPVRRNATWDYQRAFDPFPFGGYLKAMPMDWHLAMNEPVRPKPRLGAHQQPSENTPYFVGNLPFKRTGPLYLNGRHVNGGQTVWRGRTRT